MKENPIITINRITMYIWLACGIFGIIMAVYYYLKGYEGITMFLGVSLISFLMFGWKKFQLAKFGSQSNS